MGRQVFGEPSGSPGLCWITCDRFTPALHEPDGRCEHEGSTDDHEEAGESFMPI
jgi:hypothetical protein